MYVPGKGGTPETSPGRRDKTSITSEGSASVSVVAANVTASV